MKKRIYITGSAGLVGSRFLELLSSSYEVFAPEVNEVDITNKKSLDAFINKNTPDIIVNFAAYTDVGKAEEERDNRQGLVWKINVEGVRNLVESINADKMHLIHISTDMVFPGSKDLPGPYLETNIPTSDSGELTWYGFTKGEGERVILDFLGNKATILRLIYPVRAKFARKLDYLRKPLSLFDEGKLYPMFSDQQVSIAFIDEVSEALNKIIVNGMRGVFHASSRDTSTPYELVSYLLEKARGVKDVVKPQTLDEFIQKTSSNPVRYPRFGGLRVEKTEQALGMKFSTCKEIIDELIKQGIGQQA